MLEVQLAPVKLHEMSDPKGLPVQHDEATGVVVRSAPFKDAFNEDHSCDDGHDESKGVDLQTCLAETLARERASAVVSLSHSMFSNNGYELNGIAHGLLCLAHL